MNSNASTSGWLFEFPQGQDSIKPAGFVLSNRGGIVMNCDSASVKQSILMLLSTLPGERIGRPTYGCNLKKLVFEPNDEATAGMAIHYVNTAIRNWEPRVIIKRIRANSEPVGSSRLVITMEYQVRKVGTEEMLTFALDLQ